MIPDLTGAHPETRARRSLDLFELGRAANEMRSRLFGGTGIFSRSRRLLPTGVWQGPRDAPDAYVEAADVETLGGFAAARKAGARILLVGVDAGAVRAANEAGLRSIVRVPYRSAEPAARRQEVLEAVRDLMTSHGAEALMPTPEGEPMGLDTLTFFAQLRVQTSHGHLAADFAALGHRLAQMVLGFGADQLFGPIVAERRLRIGDNAGNPAMTRKEAALLLTGAGLEPHERLAGESTEAQPA